MSNSLPGPIVLVIGGSVAHPLLLTTLFLSSQRPLPNASALALEYFSTCDVIGISGLLLFGGAESTVSTVGRIIIATIGTMLIVLGLRSSPSHSASCSERSSSSEATWGSRA